MNMFWTGIKKACLVAVFALAVLIPQVTLAALEVEFQAIPLFVDADVKPGDVVSRTVIVRNTGTETQDIIFDFRNEFSDGLADVMELAVTDPGTVYVDNFFTNLFAMGEINLGQLGGGAQTTYTFTASLDPSIGNAYQLTEFGFDIVIGFASGQTVTDGGGGSGGGGGSNSGSVFNLFNEAVTTPTNSSAELTWNTNKTATSYAVCGNVSAGPFVLDPAAPFFGYQFASVENTAKVLQHTVTFRELLIGEYECRVASREDVGDGFTVSGVLEFAFDPAGLVDGITTSAPLQPNIAGNIFTPVGQIAGASTGGKGTMGGPTYEQWRAELDARRALEIEAELDSLDPIPASESDALRDRQAEVFDLVNDTNQSNTTRNILWGAVALLVLTFLAWLGFRGRP